MNKLLLFLEIDMPNFTPLSPRKGGVEDGLDVYSEAREFKSGMPKGKGPTLTALGRDKGSGLSARDSSMSGPQRGLLFQIVACRKLRA